MKVVWDNPDHAFEYGQKCTLYRGIFRKKFCRIHMRVSGAKYLREHDGLEVCDGAISSMLLVRLYVFTFWPLIVKLVISDAASVVWKTLSRPSSHWKPLSDLPKAKLLTDKKP